MVTSNFFYIVILDEQIEGNVGYLKDRTVLNLLSYQLRRCLVYYVLSLYTLHYSS